LICIDGNKADHVCTFLYSFNNITLKMAAITSEIWWWG